MDQQAFEKTIRRTSDAAVIRDCNRVIRLNPTARQSPEAQAASVVVPRRGTTWVVFEDKGQYVLYSCRDATPVTEALAKDTTPAAPATPATSPAASLPAQPPAVARTEAVEAAAPPTSRTRVTSNPEAVKGCKYLESFLEYRTVSTFQEDVVRSGGNIGYVVATNRDGDVIGESYACPGGS